MAAPTSEEVVRILNEMRTMAQNTHFQGADREQPGRMIAWYSKTVLAKLGMTPAQKASVQGRIALLPPILRAYISPCESCKSLTWVITHVCANKITFPGSLHAMVP